MNFVRTNWPWLLLPFAIVAVLVLVAYLVTADSAAPFTYVLD